jgi:hypothetical protein
MRQKIARWMRDHDAGREGTVLHRVHDLLAYRRPWYDWGHPLMILVGRYDAGTWGVPRVRDLWFRRERDGRLVATRDYTQVRGNNDGEWRIFDGRNDGHEIVIGYWPGPGVGGSISRSGIDGRDEIRLFTRWLIWDGWVKAEWFGLRRWLYYRGLHNAVEPYIPFTCRIAPPPGSGGYKHWHCRLRPRHAGDHRYVNYTWPRRPGERVKYDPKPKEHAA